MSEVEQSFDSQRKKIVEYLEQEGKGNKDVIWAYENIKDFDTSSNVQSL